MVDNKAFSLFRVVNTPYETPPLARLSHTERGDFSVQIRCLLAGKSGTGRVFCRCVFFGKNVSDLGSFFILRLLVYFQYFLYLCRGLVSERGNV